MRKVFLCLIIILAPLLYLQCSSPNTATTASRKVSIKSRLPSKVSGTAVALDSTGPTSIPLNSSNAPIVNFAMATNQPEVVLKSIRFDQTGTIKSTDITTIKLYLDNGDEIFNATTDILLTSSQFNGDACEFTLEQPVSSQVQSFFITVDLNANAAGTISFLFNDKSFNTTDIIGVTGHYPFSSTPVEVSTAPATSTPNSLKSPQPAFTKGEKEGLEIKGEEVSPTSKRAGQDSGDILPELKKPRPLNYRKTNSWPRNSTKPDSSYSRNSITANPKVR